MLEHRPKTEIRLRSGMMGGMPRLTKPPGQPKEVTTAIKIMGNEARTEILRRLVLEGPLTVPELAAAVGSSTMSAYRHVLALEEAGLVTGDLPVGERAGRTVSWSVDVDAVRRVPHTWLSHVLGSAESAG